MSLCKQAQVCRPGKLSRVADVVTCAEEAWAGGGGDSRGGSCEPGGPGQLPAALGAGEAAVEEGWSLGKVHGGVPAATHIRLIPEARDAEGLQQVTTTEQEDAEF